MIADLPISLASFSWIAFSRYAQWSLEFLFVWPMQLVTLILLGNIAAGALVKRPFRQDRWKREYLLVFANLLFFPGILVVGILGAVDPSAVPRPKPNPFAVWASNGMFFLPIALGIYWIWRMKGLRWFALATVLMQQWILLAAGFIAGMSLSGDWL